MGLVAGAAGTPGAFDEDPPVSLKDRRLRSKEPSDLISGPAAERPIVQAQAYLAIGAGLIGLLTLALPHPSYFNVPGLLAVQLFALGMGVWALTFPSRVPFWLLRIGPGIAAVDTTIAVILSGDATSGYAMFYLWVGLYAFYFPGSRRQTAFYVLFTAANYLVAIALTPTTPAGSGAGTEIYSSFVIAAGTLVTAGILLTYLRGRVERLISRLTDAAHTDPLTGLPNRAGFYRALDTEIERVRPDKRPVSALVIDVDFFKEVNRRHGTESADSTLQQLGSLLENSTRLIDSVARLEGQQFAVLLPELDKNAAYLVAEQLLGKVRDVFRPPAVVITISVGISTFPEDGEERDALFQAATDSLRAAKVLGRNRAVVFSPEVEHTLTSAGRRASLEREANLSSALSLATKLDGQDPYTTKHSQTVGELCKQTVRELGMTEGHAQRVQLAGVLHDIGKVAVPEAIVRKPGPLNDEEWAQMRRHPELGARILSGPGLEDLRGWVLAHHERPDGRGYPKGLSAVDIPLEASVLAVCDAYEAMTSDRIYGPAIGAQAASEELRRCAGTQFEPAVVDALLSAVAAAGAIAES
jgi:diguanylate cyclase (GGDEF)-like protein